MEFGKRLRLARVNKGLTQPQLASAVGVALRSYQFYEQGRRRPSYELLVKLAIELNVSIDWLLGLSDEASFDG